MTHDGATAPATRASFTVGNHLTAASSARSRVSQFCDALPDSVRITAVLLTSELVTNALETCEEAIDLALSLEGGALCVEVTHACEGHPEQDIHSAQAEQRWRLQILDSLSSTWGTQPGPQGRGNTVWFTLA
jgi:hypothetical protein